jgi:hypothetical protein
MGASPSRVSRFQLQKSRIDRLIERLHRTSFRDRLERELLVAELRRTLAKLPSAAKPRRALGAGESGSGDAVAAVRGAVRALAAPEATEAWRNRVVRLEAHLSLLLAAEEDLLEAPGPVAA